MSLLDDHQLSIPEKQLVTRWWQDCYDTIATKGYRLHDEYHPTARTSRLRPCKRSFNNIVDSGIIVSALAYRERDKFPVILTWIPPSFSPKYPERDPHNHCTPSLGVFVLKDNRGSHKIVVTPFLHPFDKLQFKTVLDFINFFVEICEGIRFMHERNIAYRACTAKNIVWTEPPLVHPDNGTRHPHRYYLFDFGFSHQYPTRDEMDSHPGGRNGSAPEHELGDPCNPFRTDIYYTGILVREKIMNKYHGLRDMHTLVELVDEMTLVDPFGRPCIEEVVNKLHPIKQNPGVDPLRALEPSSGLWRLLGRLFQA